MKTSIIFTALLFILIITSCDECRIPPFPQHEAGDTLWIHELPGKDSLFINPSLAIGKDGSIYYGASGGTLWWHPARIFAIHKENGTIKWESEKMDHNALSSEIVVGDDGTIYAIGFHKLYAFDPKNGSNKWIWEVPETLPADGYPNGVYSKGQIGSLALTSEGNLICGSVGGGVYSRTLYCIGKNGQKIWHNRDATVWGIDSRISVGKNNIAYYYSDLVYGDILKNSLIAVNAATGSIQWKLPITSQGAFANHIAIKEDGNLFCSFRAEGATDFKYHLINGSNGNILWTSTEPGSTDSKWIGPEGSLYAYVNGSVCLINPADGSKTKIVEKGSVCGAINANNRIAGAFTDADLKRKLCVFYPDGLLDFSVPMDGLEGYEMVISDDKVMYGIINRPSPSRIPDKICAIQGNAKLAGSGWPRISHDNRNTSNINKY